MHERVSERVVDADVESMWQAFESIGAEHGWSAAPPAWALRGWTGRNSNGQKRSPARSLNACDAPDWWRVEPVDRPHKLRLRADVPLPGRLWLELSASPEGRGRCRFGQRLVFQPYGLIGEAFWGAFTPLRDVMFAGVARDITAKSGSD